MERKTGTGPQNSFQTQMINKLRKRERK